MPDSPETIAGVADVDCSGKTVLITGSTSGIGRAAALACGRMGADVLVHGRDAAAGNAVVDEIESTGASASFFQADFAEVDAVEGLISSVRETTDGLDVLINNAGGFFRSGERTELGVEYTFHVNHLSPYLLTTELLDHCNDGARIVTTASGAHRGASLDLDRVESVDSYAAMWAYSHSKLANILFSSEIAWRLGEADIEITANSLHPGAIPGSGFWRFLPGPLSRLVSGAGWLPGVTTVADGAAELLHAAFSPRIASVSGRYFASQRPQTPSEAARDTDAANRLWTYSADVLDIPEPLAADATAE